MTDGVHHQVSVFRAGLGCRCPRCGRGKLYSGFLQVADRCSICGLEMREHDSGDGPAVFIMFIMGFIVVGGALGLELSIEPPMWLHMFLWIPTIIIGSAVLLRPFKATFIALQFKHKVYDYGRSD